MDAPQRAQGDESVSGAIEPMQHLPGLEPIVRDPAEIALPAIEEHKPVAIYAMLSGGHDSAAVARWAAEHLSVDALLHINTTIGVEETREFVRRLAKDYSLPLIEEARDDYGNGYEELVQEFGFPGPGFHGLPYSRLKERVLRRVIRRAKDGKPRTAKVALISGVRRQESERRMGLSEPVTHVGSQLWVNPFFDYSTPALALYRREAGVPINDVAALLGKSGECYCGAFAKPGELEDTTALGFPAVERQIRRLERKMKAQGHPASRWGERPPRRIAAQQRKAGQLEMFNPHMPMCVGCGPTPDDERQAT